jgi:hypothetical protein
MPVRNSTPANQSLQHYKSLYYETLAASWLLSDGWDVFLPMIDHGLKTDFVISDDAAFKGIYLAIQITPKFINDEFQQFCYNRVVFTLVSVDGVQFCLFNFIVF